MTNWKLLNDQEARSIWDEQLARFAEGVQVTSHAQPGVG